MTTGQESPNESKSKTYVLSIQILFGIIIGISFIDYHKTLVPFNPNFETLMIFVAYATVLMSLIGYSLAIKNRFHKNFSRFFIDIFLLYLYYQLVYSLQTGFDYFLWIFPIIFGSYVVWQVLEYYEWKGDDNKKPYKIKEYKWVVLGTLGFTIAFLLIAVFYSGTVIVEDRLDDVLHYLDVSIIEWCILCLLVALVFGFRIFFYFVLKYKLKSD